MKNINNYINEASINAKKRQARFVKKMFLNGKKYGNINSFGIVTANNMDSTEQTHKENKSQNKELYTYLKKNHYAVVPSKGRFEENKENSYVVFNIELDLLKKLAGKYEQTSFFYCYPDGKHLIAEYWQKTDIHAPYDRSKNDYEFINKTDKWDTGSDTCYTAVGKEFKFALDPAVFDKVNEQFTENIKLLCEKVNVEYSEDKAQEMLEWATIHTGPKAGAYRAVIYDFN